VKELKKLNEQMMNKGVFINPIYYSEKNARVIAYLLERKKYVKKEEVNEKQDAKGKNK